MGDAAMQTITNMRRTVSAKKTSSSGSTWYGKRIK